MGQTFGQQWQQYRDYLYRCCFPQQLLAQGFDEQGSDGVEDFFFREDGYKIWNALTEYVGNVVAAVCKDDAALEGICKKKIKE